MSYYLVRVGECNKYIQEAKKGKTVNNSLKKFPKFIENSCPLILLFNLVIPIN